MLASSWSSLGGGNADNLRRCRSCLLDTSRGPVESPFGISDEMDQLGLERSSSTLICCFIASLASLLVENKRCEAVCTLFGSSLRLAVHAAMEDILADELRQFCLPKQVDRNSLHVQELFIPSRSREVKSAAGDSPPTSIDDMPST